jgi:hypothetical protein
MATKTKKTHFIVERDCCLDGYCGVCWPFPRSADKDPFKRRRTNDPKDGTRVRVIQQDTPHKELALRTEKGWFNYRPTIRMEKK